MYQSIGQKAEKMAALWLKSQGWTIIASNIRAGRVEIDLLAYRRRWLAMSPRGVYCIFEVKYRDSDRHGYAAQYVDRRKLERLVRARAYLARSLKLRPRDAVQIGYVAYCGGFEKPDSYSFSLNFDSDTY